MSRDTSRYHRLARNEARFRLKESVLEEMIKSVDEQDKFHETFMRKIRDHRSFNNILLPSDIREIEQAIERRKVKNNLT